MPYGRFLILIGTLACGCDSKPIPPPTPDQQLAKLARDSASQTATAAEEVKHVSRLRDLDQMKYRREVADLHSENDSIRGMSKCLVITLLAAILWLAVEIRRRRILTAVLAHQAQPEPRAPPERRSVARADRL